MSLVDDVDNMPLRTCKFYIVYTQAQAPLFHSDILDLDLHYQSYVDTFEL